MNEFVIYPLSLRMKALGFNEPCFAIFTNKYKYGETHPKAIGQHEGSSMIGDKNSDFKSQSFWYVTAPTWQSAFAWLIPQINDEYKVSFRKEGWFIYNLEDGEFKGSEALEKLIEIVEKKQK